MNIQHWQGVDMREAFAPDLRGWLAQQMTQEMPWLLVHADDGVIWGRRAADGELLLSSDVPEIKARYPSTAVTLRVETLQQARVFGPAGELLVWRSEPGFAARRIMDGPNAPADAWEEPHLLWGRRVWEAAGFSVLEEGQQGPVHAVPFVAPAGRRAALTVRHYIQPDNQGQAVVTLSRLVQLGLLQAQAGGSSWR